MNIPYNTDTQLVDTGNSKAGFLSGLPGSAYFLLAAPALRVICERNRPHDQFAAIDNAAMLQIAFAFIAGLWVFYRLRNNYHEFRQLIRSQPACYLVAFLFLAGLSTIWSTHPALTFYRCIEAFVYLGLIIDIILTVKNIQKSILIIIIYSTLVFIGFLTISGPLQLLHGRPMKIGIGDNIAGVVGAVCLFLCAPLLKQHRFRFYLWFCFFAITVILSHSLATYVSVLTASVFIIVVRPFKQIQLQTIAFIAIGAIVLLGIWFGPSTVLSRTILSNETPESLWSGSGRLGIWQSYWDNAISNRPWTGSGYEAGEHQLKGIDNAHNAYVASAVSLGLPGFLLVVLLAGSTIYHAAKIPGAWGTAILAAIICAWINSLSIPSISSRVRESWIIMAYLCTLIAGIKSALVNTEDSTSSQIS